MKKTLIQNNYAPSLLEEEINKIVRELSDPNLDLSTQNSESEEELLLIKVLTRKLKEGKIKVEMTDDGKLWLKTSNPVLGGIAQIKYQNSSLKKGNLRKQL